MNNVVQFVVTASFQKTCNRPFPRFNYLYDQFVGQSSSQASYIFRSSARKVASVKTKCFAPERKLQLPCSHEHLARPWLVNLAIGVKSTIGCLLSPIRGRARLFPKSSDISPRTSAAQLPSIATSHSGAPYAGFQLVILVRARHLCWRRCGAPDWAHEQAPTAEPMR